MRKLIVLFFLVINGFAFSQTTHEIWMHAKMNGVVALDDGTYTNYWGFGYYTPPEPISADGISLPGPLLRFNEGDSVRINFYNNSNESHTIHWHGLDVNQANDGVPTTSSQVLESGSRVYAFRCNDAGTFNYHCHVSTTLHLAMGMYGQFIVDVDSDRNKIYAGGPTYTLEHSWLASEMNRLWNQNALSPGLFTLYKANYFMINGKSGNQLLGGAFDVIANPNDTIALRMSNMGYGSVRYIFPSEANASIHMSDGRALPTVITSDTVELYSGERYTVLLDPDVNFTDTIEVEYIDTRTNEIQGYNRIPMTVFPDASVPENTTNQGIHLVQNPVDNYLQIESNNADETPIQIINMSGQIIGEYKLQKGLNIIPFTLLQGAYFIQSEEQSIRFIKK